MPHKTTGDLEIKQSGSWLKTWRDDSGLTIGNY